MDASQFDKMSSQADQIMGPFADVLLRQAGFPPSADKSALVVLDTACGSGVVASHIMGLLASRRTGDEGDQTHLDLDLDLTCADISEAMVSNATRRIETSGWRNTRAVIADAMDTKFPTSHFTHVFFSFGPFILPDGLAGLRECRRILQPNGVLGFTTWKEVPWVADYRAGMARDPSLPAFLSDEQFRRVFSDKPERWDIVDQGTENFRACGFEGVDVQIAENTTRMELDEVKAMLPFTLGMMIQKVWAKEDVDKYQDKAGEAIVDYLKEKYAGGPILWKWVSIIATGRKA